MKLRNIALIGFRATGKSSVGILLAKKLHRVFLDMDEELMGRLEMDIQKWVELHGWPSFRDAEAQLLGELSGEKNLVVATGGGVVERETNRELLKMNFVVIWLHAPSAAILERLEKDPATASNRPPLTQLAWKDEVREVLERRDPLYEQCAHLKMDTNTATIEETVEHTLEALRSLGIE